MFLGILFWKSIEVGFVVGQNIFYRIMFFMGRNKATVRNNFANINRCITYNTFTKGNRISKKTYRIITANGNVITRYCEFKRNVSNIREN